MSPRRGGAAVGGVLTSADQVITIDALSAYAADRLPQRCVRGAGNARFINGGTANVPGSAGSVTSPGTHRVLSPGGWSPTGSHGTRKR